MDESWLQQLHAWHDFYVLVGTAAATLTGLMFVVVSLGPHTFASGRTTGVRAFVSPTVVYFTSVLVVAALLTVPVLTATALAVVLALGSLGTLAYLVSRRGHRQWRESKLDVADWAWYIGLPTSSYVLLIFAAALTWMRLAIGLDLVGAIVILLLVIAIRNAWDLVFWTAQKSRP